MSPLSPLDRLGDQAEPPHSGSSQSQHVSDPDGDKSPAQSGYKSPHSKKWDASARGIALAKFTAAQLSFLLPGLPAQQFLRRPAARLRLFDQCKERLGQSRPGGA